MRIIKEGLSFLLTFGTIFLVSFVLLNFSAFKTILQHYFTGEQKQEMMQESVEINYEKQAKKIQPVIPSKAKKLIKKVFPKLFLTVSPLDFRLVIPKIGKNVPIVKMSDNYITEDFWGKFEKEAQTALKKGIVHYPGTALPGQVGNAFFTGHSSYYPWDDGAYKEVFANLNLLEKGDEYFVYLHQKKIKYKVIEKKEVKPYEVKILEQPEDKKLSTLMTCWPLGTTLKRLIVVAEEV